jgi:hypothetical protein
MMMKEQKIRRDDEEEKTEENAMICVIGRGRKRRERNETNRTEQKKKKVPFLSDFSTPKRTNEPGASPSLLQAGSITEFRIGSVDPLQVVPCCVFLRLIKK